jgi:hypothetical protein
METKITEVIRKTKRKTNNRWQRRTSRNQPRDLRPVPDLSKQDYTNNAASTDILMQSSSFRTVGFANDPAIPCQSLPGAPRFLFVVGMRRKDWPVSLSLTCLRETPGSRRTLSISFSTPAKNAWRGRFFCWLTSAKRVSRRR